MSEKINCLIIGSGPAGYTAAIYAARANMNPVLYQGIQPGGQLTTTTDVENFPGYPNGISGPEMMVELQKQAERFGTDIRNGWITKVDFSDKLKLWVNDEHELECQTVIISTGASAKYLGLDSEKKYLESGGGVSACAVCDGFFYKNQQVVIVGGGDSACEEAHYLSKLCSKVTMLVRRDEFRASKIMQERVMKTKNIEILFNTSTVEVKGDGQLVTSILTKNNLSEELKDIPATDSNTPKGEDFKQRNISSDTVINSILLTENYRQSPYNQGLRDSSRFREQEGMSGIITELGRDATTSSCNGAFVGYHLVHNVPRFNNPNGVFDNDQYHYTVYVKRGSATLLENAWVALAVDAKIQKRDASGTVATAQDLKDLGGEY